MNKKEEIDKIVLDDITFVKYKIEGYYFSSIGGFYHRYIWEKEYGEIPEGYDIHHVDYLINGKSNNSLENLQCLTKSEHASLHSSNRSEETRRKISENSKGRTHSAEAKIKMGNSHRGKKMSEESKQKLREVNLGKVLSEKHKKKIGESSKGKGTKKVKCIETGIIYSSLTEASLKLKIDCSSIGKCCKGLRKTAGGFHWEYVDEEENRCTK